MKKVSTVLSLLLVSATAFADSSLQGGDTLLLKFDTSNNSAITAEYRKTCTRGLEDAYQNIAILSKVIQTEMAKGNLTPDEARLHTEIAQLGLKSALTFCEQTVGTEATKEIDQDVRSRIQN
jgi:hypothetical protein